MKRSILCAAVCVVLATAAAHAEVIATLDIGHDVAPNTAEAIYNRVTGELIFDVGENIGVVGFGSSDQVAILDPDAINWASIFGSPAQFTPEVIAYFDPHGLPVGEDSLGFLVHPDLTQKDVAFTYVAIGEQQVWTPVTIVPEPSVFALLAMGIVGLFLRLSRRRSAWFR